MKHNYYQMINEGFNKYLVEAQQVVIDFKRIFGEDLLARFNAQKQRMPSPINDISYWVRKFNNEGDSVIHELSEIISEFENKLSRRELSRQASDGADVLFEDDTWLVLKINTYEAAAKYGKGTIWCITGRYPGHEGELEGQRFFDMYKDEHDWDYYFYIKKNESDDAGRQLKWCLCWDGESSDYQIWESDGSHEDEMSCEGIPGAPHVDGLPDVSQPKPGCDDEDDFEDEEDFEPAQPAQRNFNIIPVTVEDLHILDSIPSDSIQHAVSEFHFKGMDGIEVAEDLGNGKYIVKVHLPVEPEEGEENLEPDNGERFIMFICFVGEVAGPILNGNPFQGHSEITACKDIEDVRRLAGQELRRADENGNEDNGELVVDEPEIEDDVEESLTESLHFDNIFKPGNKIKFKVTTYYSDKEDEDEDFIKLCKKAGLIFEDNGEIFIPEETIAEVTGKKDESGWPIVIINGVELPIVDDGEITDVIELEESLTEEWEDLNSYEDVVKFTKDCNGKWCVGQCLPDGETPSWSNGLIDGKRFYDAYTKNGDRFVGDREKCILALKDKDGNIVIKADKNDRVIKEAFYYFDYKIAESCKLKEDIDYYYIFVGNEEVCDWFGEPLHFNTFAEAEEFALDELELLPGDFDILAKHK